MPRSLPCFLYRCLLRLHPPSFQRQFAQQMLCIFDEAAAREGVVRLFADGLASLARQWLVRWALQKFLLGEIALARSPGLIPGDRKSTRLNSSHLVISYAVFCLKKKK